MLFKQESLGVIKHQKSLSLAELGRLPNPRLTGPSIGQEEPQAEKQQTSVYPSADGNQGDRILEQLAFVPDSIRQAEAEGREIPHNYHLEESRRNYTNNRWNTGNNERL